MKPPNDEFSDFYNWLSSLSQNKDLQRKIEAPTNREVELVNKWKEVNTADSELERVRRLYMLKIQEFNTRWRNIESGQLELKQHLVKFNNFVREKQGRVESGEEKRQQERQIQENSNQRLQELSQLIHIFLQAKSVLESAVQRKTVFSDFLESVVAREQGKYPEVRTLMNRCQGLVISRDKLKDRLHTLTVEIEREERDLDKFREEKMTQTLDYNVRLSDQQQLYCMLAAKTLERMTHLRNIEDQSTEKRVLISNIKLAILNMFTYTLTRAVTLPGDREGQRRERSRMRSICDQLTTIIAHIEDLELVTSRVYQSENSQGYNAPLATDITH